MIIKHAKPDPIAVDVSEWNDDVKAFIKPIDSMEALVINDWVREFYDRGIPNEKRFEAVFQIIKTVLVGEDNELLLTDDDFESVRFASFRPLFRVLAGVLEVTAPGKSVPSAKKN